MLQAPLPSVGSVLGYQVGYRAIDEEERGEEGWEWRVVRAGAGPGPRTATQGPAPEDLETSIGSLRHFTRYEVVVRAFNQVGHGPPTPPLYTTTQEGGELHQHPFLRGMLKSADRFVPQF